MNANIPVTMPTALRGAADAERLVVGCALRGAEEADHARGLVTLDDFAYYPARLVFETILSLRDRNRPVSDDAVLIEMRSAGTVDDLGPAPGDFLNGLLRAHPESLAAAAEQVRDASRRRRLVYLASEVIRDASDNIGPADELIDRFHRQLGELQADGAVVDGPVKICDTVRAAIRRYDGKDPIPRVTTGFPTIDRMTGAYKPGELWIVGARTSVGKSAFALRTVDAVARSGAGVLVFQLEMSRDECTDRLVAMSSRVQLSRLRGMGTPDADQARRVMEAAGGEGRGLISLPAWIDDRTDRTASQIAAVARRWIRRHGVRLVVVDYLQLVRPEDRKAQRYQQVGDMAKRLKLLARQCGVTVLALAQLNREAVGRVNERPKLAHFRDSGDLEQDADVAILLHRADEDEKSPTHTIEAIIAKARNAMTGTVTLDYQRAFTRFDEREHTIGM